MLCVENCKCILCLELPGCDTNLTSPDKQIDDNFILTVPKNSVLKTVSELENKLNKICERKFSLSRYHSDEDIRRNKYTARNSDVNNESVHKSVIYISGTLNAESNVDVNNCETIDDATTLTNTAEDKNIINVLFRNSYTNAQQIISEISCENSCCEYGGFEDDFPLGMEADLLNRLQNNQR